MQISTRLLTHFINRNCIIFIGGHILFQKYIYIHAFAVNNTCAGVVGGHAVCPNEWSAGPRGGHNVDGMEKTDREASVPLSQ